jgi:hypothetical protein
MRDFVSLSYFGTLQQVSLLRERECVDAHRGAGFATRRSDRFLPRSGDKRRVILYNVKIEHFHTAAQMEWTFFRATLRRAAAQILRLLSQNTVTLFVACALHTAVPWAPRAHVAKGLRPHCSTPVAPLRVSRVCTGLMLLTRETQLYFVSFACATELHTEVHVCGIEHKKIQFNKSRLYSRSKTDRFVCRASLLTSNIKISSTI